MQAFVLPSVPLVPLPGRILSSVASEVKTKFERFEYKYWVSAGTADRIASAEAEGLKEQDPRAAHEAKIRRDVSSAVSEIGARRELLVRFKPTMEAALREHQLMMQMVLANH